MGARGLAKGLKSNKTLKSLQLGRKNGSFFNLQIIILEMKELFIFVKLQKRIPLWNIWDYPVQILMFYTLANNVGLEGTSAIISLFASGCNFSAMDLGGKN